MRDCRYDGGVCRPLGMAIGLVRLHVIRVVNDCSGKAAISACAVRIKFPSTPLGLYLACQSASPPQTTPAVSIGALLRDLVMYEPTLASQSASDVKVPYLVHHDRRCAVL